MTEYDIKLRRPKQEYVGEWNMGVAKDIKNLGLNNDWVVFDTETGEHVGGGATKKSALKTLEALMLGGDNCERL